jgi:hypothetical protein
LESYTRQMATRPEKIFFFAYILFWLAFLFFHRGQLTDEVEHAHVAWLISQGQRPLEDFFQHHYPLLWDFLSLYYLMGLEGANVLIWGRLLVVLSGICALISLLSIEHGNFRKALRAPISLGFLTFSYWTVFLPELFVSRPETISIAFFMLALAIWNCSQSRHSLTFLSGLLYSMSLFASPRSVLLIGYFLILGSVNCQRLSTFVFALFFFAFIYMFFTGFSIEKAYFCSRFSAHLQTITDGNMHGDNLAAYLLILAINDVVFLYLLNRSHHISQMKRQVLIAYINCIFIACLVSAKTFQFHQAYAPFVIAAAVTAAYINKGACEIKITTITTLLLFLALRTSYMREDHFDFLRQVRATQAMADIIPSDQKVLMFAMTHPITRHDASYFGSPLADTRNRLCRAVVSFQSTIALPPCHFFRDLEKSNVFMTDSAIWYAMPEQETAIQEFLRTNYQYGSFPSETLPLFERIRDLRPSTDSTMRDQVLMIRRTSIN